MTNKIKIPNNYKLIKLVSFNVRLLFGSPLRANKIGYYLIQPNNYINNSIICLQGLYDYESRKIIIDIVKDVYPHIYVIPDNTHIIEGNIKKYCIGTVILSIYPILDYVYLKFEENNRQVPEYTGIISVNINIENNILSIYNVQLQSDYKNITNNTTIRSSQISKLDTYIENNINHIYKRYKRYTQTNIHLVTASLNVSQKEYDNIFKKYNYIDIYKIINGPYKVSKKQDYILLYISNNKHILYTPIVKNILINLKMSPDITVIKQFIYKCFKINFLLFTCTETDYSEHIPCNILILFKIK